MRSGTTLLAALAWLLACGEPEAPAGARVVLCGESVARLVLDLGAAPQVLGADRASRALPGLGGAVDLGESCSDAAARAPSLAAELALLDGNAPQLAAHLASLGVPARVLAPRDLNGVLAVYRELGALLGAEIRALALQAELARDIAAIAGRRGGRQRLQVALLLSAAEDGDGWQVTGGSGILHEMLELAGAENAFHIPLTARRGVTPEELARSGAELVLDASGRPERAAATVTAELRVVPGWLVRVPILDPLPRIEALHELLYPESEAD